MTSAFETLIGRPDGNDKSRIWFARWFLKVGILVAPGCTWEVKGNQVWRTYHDDYVRPSGKPNVPPTVWVLTDEYDRTGWNCSNLMRCPTCWNERLGVWPD
jgi:hypothetical protein